MSGFNHKSVFEAYFPPLSVAFDSKTFNTDVGEVSFDSFFFYVRCGTNLGNYRRKARSQGPTLTLRGPDSWSHFNLSTLLKMSPSIPW